MRIRSDHRSVTEHSGVIYTLRARAWSAGVRVTLEGWGFGRHRTRQNPLETTANLKGCGLRSGRRRSTFELGDAPWFQRGKRDRAHDCLIRKLSVLTSTSILNRLRSFFVGRLGRASPGGVLFSFSLSPSSPGISPASRTPRINVSYERHTEFGSPGHPDDIQNPRVLAH